MKLLLASENKHKREELAALLAPNAIEVLSPTDVGGLPPVEENGTSFAEIARQKALLAAAHSGLWSLADDSGLEVEHLNGAPGVRSARFAGEPSNDRANNQLLLERLAGVPEHRRGARFVCALALARPLAPGTAEVVGEFHGAARGRILRAARGANGFGYDPLFLFTEEDRTQTGRTFAELDVGGKSLVSHRGRALRELLSHLPDLLPMHPGSGRSS